MGNKHACIVRLIFIVTLLFALPASSISMSRLARAHKDVTDAQQRFWSMADQLTNVDGTLFFTTLATRTNTYELWKSDGTTAGTVRLKGDFPYEPNYGEYSGLNELTNVNGTLFFTSHDSTSQSSALWKSDGTTAGTVIVAKGFADNVYQMPGPSSLTAVNNRLLFSVFTELWVSDGTSEGTMLLKGVKPCYDFYPGFCRWVRTELVGANDVAYFRHYGENGWELWKSDGTPEGTLHVANIYPQSMENVNGLLFFTANVDASGWELWKSDGTTTGTTLVKRFDALNYPIEYWLTNVEGTLFFTTWISNSFDLWKSDGTEPGTRHVRSFSRLSTNEGPVVLTNVDGTLFFLLDDGSGSDLFHSVLELWKSDGTETGTVRVKGGFPYDTGGPASLPELAAVGSTLFFAANDTVHGQELWTSDGTEAGTRLVKDILPGPSASRPIELTDMGGRLFFTTLDSYYGSGLWTSDGTEPGTWLVKDTDLAQRFYLPFMIR